MKISTKSRDLAIRPDALERLRLAHENFPWISIQEVSVKYGVSIRTLRRWQKEGKLPEERKKHGRKKLYLKTEVEASIQKKRR